MRSGIVLYFLAVSRDVDYKINLWPELNFAIITKGITRIIVTAELFCNISGRNGRLGPRHQSSHGTQPSQRSEGAVTPKSAPTITCSVRSLSPKAGHRKAGRPDLRNQWREMP